MKYVGSVFSKLAACGLALGVTSFSIQAQQNEGTARVQAIRGTAEYQSGPGASFAKLTVGKTLKSGATIKTAVNSQVDLFLKQNGPVVRVTADTTLALDKLLYEDTPTGEPVIDTELNLSNGRILGNVKKLAATSQYNVKIPTGTVGIRGTEYDISANGKVSINEGSAFVQLTGVTGPPAQVNQGQTFNPPTTPGQQGVVINLPPNEAVQLNITFKGPDGVETISIEVARGGPPPPAPRQANKGEKTGSDTLAPPASNPRKSIGTTATITVTTSTDGTHATITITNPNGVIVTIPDLPVTGGIVQVPPTVPPDVGAEIGKIPLPPNGTSGSGIVPLPIGVGGDVTIVLPP